MSNQILPFGIGAGANVIPYADYEALPARTGGFVSGVARSEQLNTVWRQSSFVASVLAQFIASRSGQDVLDDGDTIKLLTNLELAIKTYANNNLPEASTTIAGIAKLSSEINSSSEVLAATPKAVKTVSDASLKTANNLSEIKDAGTSAQNAARANIAAAALIGLATQVFSVANATANNHAVNLAQLNLTITALGLGTASKANIGTGTGQVPSMASFTSGPGWVRFPDGTIIQRGSSIAGSVSYPAGIYFSIPFTNADFKVTTAFDSASYSATDCPAFATSPIGLAGFYLMSSRVGAVTGAGAHWIAVGR
ncbi:phage tail protein [Yersinia intermedia]|uniref:phage tail protein n=1 Tax=Yersinia intermedia TaxID=631 RepID=UPI00065D4386|nr:phage tail protein [Yersinia intermedia]CRY80211.1 tail fiber repeat 2-containing protein [Yersinia intermedia]